MALSSSFTAAGLSATITGLVGNVAFSLLGLNDTSLGTVTLEVSYDAGVTYQPVKRFTPSDMPMSQVLVSPDGLAIFRLRCHSILAGGEIQYYIGQEAAV